MQRSSYEQVRQYFFDNLFITIDKVVCVCVYRCRFDVERRSLLHFKVKVGLFFDLRARFDDADPEGGEGVTRGPSPHPLVHYKAGVDHELLIDKLLSQIV